jgi:hypothetical protein
MRQWIAGWFVVVVVGGVAAAALAEDFRIETKVFVGKEEEPISRSTTLFRGGVVYDFLDEPEQIAVFRNRGGGQPGRFILLDPKRRVKTELTTDQLAGAMNKLKNWAARQRDPYLKFAANPTFEESFDRETGQLLLASHEASYTIETEAADAHSTNEYREFLDWYSKLNTLIHAGPPPEPRLEVNAALARYQVLPVKVELARKGEKEKLRAEHDFAWLLSKNDLGKIDDASAAVVAYRQVDNEQYLEGLQRAVAEDAEDK